MDSVNAPGKWPTSECAAVRTLISQLQPRPGTAEDHGRVQGSGGSLTRAAGSFDSRT